MGTTTSTVCKVTITPKITIPNVPHTTIDTKAVNDTITNDPKAANDKVLTTITNTNDAKAVNVNENENDDTTDDLKWVLSGKNIEFSSGVLPSQTTFCYERDRTAFDDGQYRLTFGKLSTIPVTLHEFGPIHSSHENEIKQIVKWWQEITNRQPYIFNPIFGVLVGQNSIGGTISVASDRMEISAQELYSSAANDFPLSHKIHLLWILANGLHSIHNGTAGRTWHGDVHPRLLLLGSLDDLLVDDNREENDSKLPLTTNDIDHKVVVTNMNVRLEMELRRTEEDHNELRYGFNHYSSPEALSHLRRNVAPMSSASDWYSFGCMIFFLFSGHEPWYKKRERWMVNVWSRFKLTPLHIPVLSEELFPDLPRNLCLLMIRCFSYDPKDRPPGSEVLAVINKVWLETVASISERTPAVAVNGEPIIQVGNLQLDPSVLSQLPEWCRSSTLSTKQLLEQQRVEYYNHYLELCKYEASRYASAEKTL